MKVSIHEFMKVSISLMLFSSFFIHRGEFPPPFLVLFPFLGESVLISFHTIAILATAIFKLRLFRGMADAHETEAAALQAVAEAHDQANYRLLAINSSISR